MRDKKSRFALGHLPSVKRCEKCGSFIGRKIHSCKENIRKMSESLKGRSPNSGSFKKGDKRITGENHYLWKGDEVGYRNLHHWLERHLGTPNECEHCGTKGLTGKKIHWANKSGKYKRDLSDWLRLCVPCHQTMDDHPIGQLGERLEVRRKRRKNILLRKRDKLGRLI